MDNDYELLYLAKDDDQVKDLIYQKYKNLIYYKARKYSQRTTTNTTPRTRTGKILFCTTKARKRGNKTRQSGKWC